MSKCCKTSNQQTQKTSSAVLRHCAIPKSLQAFVTLRMRIVDDEMVLDGSGIRSSILSYLPGYINEQIAFFNTVAQ